MSKIKKLFSIKSLLWATYNCLLLCSTFFVAPFLICKSLFWGKYRGILLLRLGLRLPKIVVDPNKENLWVHAVSLGEVKAAKAFIDSLKKTYPKKGIYLSTLTQTGLMEANKIMGVVPFLLPGDLITWFLIRKIRPQTLFLVEGDVWPNMVLAAKNVIVINGKMSLKTARALQYFPFLKPLLLAPISFWCMQTQLYADRLKQLGVREGQIQVTGDIKISMQPVEATPFFKRGVLLASSHPMEENLVLNCLDRLGVFLMIAPRHPERFSEVEELLRAKNIPFFCSNKLTLNHFGESSVEEKFLQKGVRVLLINEIGKLPTFYRAAACTIVGGSLFPGVGGHNLIEPLLYDSFPLFGPYIDKQLHLKALLSEWNLYRDCTPENLQDRVLEFLDNPTLRSELEQSLKRARAFMDKPLALTLDRLRDLSQLE